LHGAAATRREPRRSLPAKPATPVDLLSPPVPRRMSRQSSQTSLNFSGTPDFIPASAYIDDDDRRRRATGRPTVDHELAALTLTSCSPGDRVLDNTNTPPLNCDSSFQSYDDDTDEASVPSSGSLRKYGLPVTSPPAASGYGDRRTPFVGAGSEACNGYNARTEALHSAAAASARHQRQRSQSALADAAVARPDRGAHRRPDVRRATDGDYERPAAPSRRDTNGSAVPADPASEPSHAVSSSADSLLQIITRYQRFIITALITSETVWELKQNLRAAQR